MIEIDFTHRIFTLDALVFLQSIASNSVDCVWTDPPYFLSNGGFTCVAGKRAKVHKGDWDKSQGWKIDYEFHRSWIKECYRILKPTGTIWASGTYHVCPAVGLALQEFGFRILNDIIWEVPNPTPNLGCRSFTHATETLFGLLRLVQEKRVILSIMKI
jgi:site-specific DNA-methyltransferase (adenine-specific)